MKSSPTSQCKMKDKCTCCGESVIIRVTSFEESGLWYAIQLINIFSTVKEVADYKVSLKGTFVKILDEKNKNLLYVVCDICQKKFDNDLEIIKKIILDNLKNGMTINYYDKISQVSCKKLKDGKENEK